MDISFYLIKYLQFRIQARASVLELYIADTLNNDHIEIIIKDDAEKIDENSSNAEPITELLQMADNINGQLKHLYHRKQNSVHIDWKVKQSNKISLENFHSLLAVLTLNSPQTRIVFSYLSKKGEYIFDSQKLFEEFSEEELRQKDTMTMMNEILDEQIDAVRDHL